jgi:integrase/recombinase XerD
VTDLVSPTGLPELHEGGGEDQQRWRHTLGLVGQWLVEYSGNSRAAYADAIGWPYTAKGAWRGYGAVRHGLGWLAWCYANGVAIFDLTRMHALAWIDALNTSVHPDTGEGLSKRSRAHMVSAASSFYTWAMREGHTENNPVALVDRHKQGLRTSKDRSPTRSLSKGEAHALLQAADNDPVESVRLRSAALIALLLEVGPRVSEVCNATLADLFVQDGRRILRAELKGKKEHDYALPPSVCRRIDAYLAGRPDGDRLPSRRGQTSAATVPLFATATGKPMHRVEVHALVRRLARVAGLDHPESVHPHVARHTYVTEARRQGHATAAIQASVGHEFSSTTDRYGVHIINLEQSPAYGVAEAFETAEG